MSHVRVTIWCNFVTTLLNLKRYDRSNRSQHTKGSPLPESKPQDIKTNSGLYSYATGIITWWKAAIYSASPIFSYMNTQSNHLDYSQSIFSYIVPCYIDIISFTFSFTTVSVVSFFTSWIESSIVITVKAHIQYSRHIY